MNFKKETIVELGKVIDKEFKVKLNNKDLVELAYCLLGYFDLLLKIKYREEVQKSSTIPD